MWKDKQYGTRKCINCGYLGKKDIDGLGQECFIVSGEDRESGQLSSHFDTITKSYYRTIPWCFVGKADLKNEFEQTNSQESNEKRIFIVLKKERNCSSWYPWREFSSPKEQWNESVMLAMEDRQQKFERELEEERRKFELKLSEINSGILKDSKNIVEKSDKFNRRITIILIILAVLEVAGTLLALFFPNGFIRP